MGDGECRVESGGEVACGVGGCGGDNQHEVDSGPCHNTAGRNRSGVMDLIVHEDQSLFRDGYALCEGELLLEVGHQFTGTYKELGHISAQSGNVHREGLYGEEFTFGSTISRPKNAELCKIQPKNTKLCKPSILSLHSILP